MARVEDIKGIWSRGTLIYLSAETKCRSEYEINLFNFATVFRVLVNFL